jgi:hypothetical protein
MLQNHMTSKKYIQINGGACQRHEQLVVISLIITEKVTLNKSSLLQKIILQSTQMLQPFANII